MSFSSNTFSDLDKFSKVQIMGSPYIIMAT